MTPTDPDAAERLRMVGKMFSLYPATPGTDVELKIAAYIEEVRQVPTLVLQRALGRLVRRRKSAFVPSVYEILREGAIVVREWHAQAEGRDPNAHNPAADGDMEIDIDRWIANAPHVMRRLEAGPERLRLSPPASAEERAEGAKLLERAVGGLAKRMGAPL